MIIKYSSKNGSTVFLQQNKSITRKHIRLLINDPIAHLYSAVATNTIIQYIHE